MLRAKIAAVEQQMRTKLAEIRATFSHAGSKGQHVEEEIFRGFLRQYLPRRLEIGHGEIVDTVGGRSSQTDIIIVTEDHPFTFTQDLPGLFFVEGVCAAAEVKTILDGRELEDALQKAQRFKSLRAQRAQGTLFAGNTADRDRFYTSPPYFLVATETRVSLGSLAARLNAGGRYGQDGYAPGLDAAFVLGRGWAIDFGNGDGAFQFRKGDGASLPGWVFQESDSPMFDLLAWLSSVMLRTIRFQPILPQCLVRDAADGAA